MNEGKRGSADPAGNDGRDRIARERSADEPVVPAEHEDAASRLILEEGVEPPMRGEREEPRDAKAQDALKLTAETSRRT